MEFLAEPFEVYLLYCSLKAHYSGKYDYFTHKRSSKIKYSTFEKRRDKAFFYKISKKYNLKECELFLAVNFAYNNNFWIGEFDERSTNEIYNQHIKVKYAFDYYLAQDIKFLEENGGFVESLKVGKDLYPPAIYFLKANEISFETVTFIYNVMNLHKYWKIKDNIIYPVLELKLIKFYPFLKFNIKSSNKVEFIRNIYKQIKAENDN